MSNLEAIKTWVEELEFQSQAAQIISMVNREENAQCEQEI